MKHLFAFVLVLWLLPVPAGAAIGVIIPSDDLVSAGEPPVITVHARLYDPLQRRYVSPPRLQRLAVQHLGDTVELLPAAPPARDAASPPEKATHAVKRPGDHLFFFESTPGWNPAEEQFVVHSAKLCVHAQGPEEGWDEPVGLDAEIVPLSRPYGIWTGGLFSAQVLVKGDPAPYVLIEAVSLGITPDAPPAGPLPPPPYLVQKVRADADGVFHAAMPRAGWWGFAATLDADWTVKRDGADRPVALTTSYWVLTRDP